MALGDAVRVAGELVRPLFIYALICAGSGYDDVTCTVRPVHAALRMRKTCPPKDSNPIRDPIRGVSSLRTANKPWPSHARLPADSEVRVKASPGKR